MPTTEQLDNIRRLADTLDKVAAEFPQHFNMEYWVGNHGNKDEETTSELYRKHCAGTHPKDCGTTGCALGWAPFALGEPIGTDETWADYAGRVLGVSASDHFNLFLDYDENAASGAEAAHERATILRKYADLHEQKAT